jgi:ADP-ribosyl-[dinitrogen reductase] hydrolase
MVSKDGFMSAFMGFVVGDALGVPHENRSREELLMNPVKGLDGHGTHNQPPGTWSDDTSMMLCVMENIIQTGKLKNLVELFIRWYRDGHNTPHGVCFDIGNTTRKALEDIMSNGRLTFGEKDEINEGNDALMRCLPYAFILPEGAGVIPMLRQSKITHRSWISYSCCLAFERMIRLLLNGDTIQDAHNKAMGYLRFGWRITDYDDVDTEQFSLFKRLMSDEFPSLLNDQIFSTGYVIHTYEAAVWCMLNTSSYEEAVLKAVNLGGDTDSIAALTGAMAGLVYGLDSIPKEWLDLIAKPELLSTMAEQYMQALEREEKSGIDNLF